MPLPKKKYCNPALIYAQEDLIRHRDTLRKAGFTEEQIKAILILIFNAKPEEEDDV